MQILQLSFILSMAAATLADFTCSAPDSSSSSGWCNGRGQNEGQRQECDLVNVCQPPYNTRCFPGWSTGTMAKC
ncbi:unnamed protein product [Zymoseptoria tritici ST99CH_3D7]|uniref:CBM1 domain-containing protein n=1 Tax=Zymoseptoria tritici (strain ST99CH_3D7) TaxID=1276538 RepID=A0A1X7RUP9_ZYMT9|nr:unnamed protein product [Zymoseptoria tritici ST99CH_3D7]